MVANPRLQPGPLGVAVFFLISGFVIPFSLQRQRRRAFLLARVLRIYPTYIVAQLLQMLVLWGNTRLWHTRFAYSAWDVTANGLLIENYVGVPSTDLVNWTLGVELKFYLLAALLAPMLRRGSVAALLAVGLAGLALNVAIGWAAATPLGRAHAGQLTAASYDSLCLTFLLIGTLFHFRLRRLVGRPTFLSALVLLVALFLLTWRASRIADQFPLVPEDYLYALALFALCYALRAHTPRLPPLAWMASISYPFYLVHVLVGISLLALLTHGAGLGFGAALTITLACLALFATLLHLTVESASIRLGHRVARRVPLPVARVSGASLKIP